MADQSKNARVKSPTKDKEIFLGTSEDMVVATQVAIDVKENHRGHVYHLNTLAKDDDGYYYTEKSYVGMPLMDPWRTLNRNKVTVEESEAIILIG